MRFARFSATPLGTDAFTNSASSVPMPPDVIGDDDFQLALYVINELHYTAIDGVDGCWEWAPALIGLRWRLENAFLAAIAATVPDATSEELSSVGHALREIVLKDTGPPLSHHLEVEGTLEQMREQMIHRSAYQLKEADPHSFTIPRLSGAAKAAMLEIQYDEYGSGRLDQMHSVMFGDAMRAVGLDCTYGAYLDRLPGITLSAVNLNTMFALHHRLRGASTGHLAVFEMTSSIPNRRYANALRRMGFDTTATAFYDEHVVADSVHEEIAAWELAGGLCASEPDLAADVLFGARAIMALEGRWAQQLLDSWARDESSLLPAV